MSYAQRKNKITKRDPSVLSKWANRPAPASIQKFSEEQKKLWHDLNRYVTANGGAIVSAPYSSLIRIEITSENSILPEKLKAVHPSDRGRITRVTSDGIVSAGVIEIHLPR